MKKMLLVTLIAISTISCTKSVQLKDEALINHPLVTEPGKETTTRLESLPEMSAYFGDNRMQVIVKPEPYVSCNSYKNGEAPEPCNIYINFNCRLSKSVNQYIRVEIERNNIVQSDKPDPGEGDNAVANPQVLQAGARISIIIPPNQTSIIFRSMLLGTNNNSIDRNEFKIVGAGFYTPVN